MASRHTYKKAGNIGIPKGWLPIAAYVHPSNPVLTPIRVIYNGTGSAITVTCKMAKKSVVGAIPVGPYGTLEGEFTHITAVSLDTNVFVSE